MKLASPTSSYLTDEGTDLSTNDDIQSTYKSLLAVVKQEAELRERLEALLQERVNKAQIDMENATQRYHFITIAQREVLNQVYRNMDDTRSHTLGSYYNGLFAPSPFVDDRNKFPDRDAIYRCVIDSSNTNLQKATIGPITPTDTRSHPSPRQIYQPQSTHTLSITLGTRPKDNCRDKEMRFEKKYRRRREQPRFHNGEGPDARSRPGHQNDDYLIAWEKLFCKEVQKLGKRRTGSETTTDGGGPCKDRSQTTLKNNRKSCHEAVGCAEILQDGIEQAIAMEQLAIWLEESGSLS
ncbi:hypothetical protein FRC17_004595 [Serendipita sp. 399]|nr:hypothetical protein FRC17_004595 [Serendipita sp. 399]